MYSLDSYTAKLMVDLRKRELHYTELQNARVRSGRGTRWAGLACQGGRALVQVGKQIVALGQWLEQRDPAHSSA
jgi:hypothetical protein